MRKSELPLVTAGVLSFNRKEKLQNTLERLLQVEYKNLEIIVFDNASTDGTREMLEQKFTHYPSSTLRVIYSDSNIGIDGRNVLFREARGKYLFSFDDDSYPSTSTTITQCVGIMENDESIAALCCSCIHPETGYHETSNIERFAMSGDDDTGYDIINIAGGGTLFRMADVRRTLGYDPDFFWGREENDLAFQLVHLKRRIVFYPKFVVFHRMSFESRDIYRNLYLVTRNSIWLLWKYFPFVFSIPLVLLFTVRRFLPVLKDLQRFSPVFRGVFYGISGYYRMKKKAHHFSVADAWRLRLWMFKLLYE